MSTAPQPTLSPQQYLEIERAAETRNEFFRGEMFAMAGASREHNLIATNIARRVSEQFDGRPCEVYQSDMRVKITATGLYTYPDVVTTCDAPEFEDDHIDTLLNPQVLFEVLSRSTEVYDRGKKFEHYQQLPSLTDYILVSQYSARVERFTRQSDDQWLLWSTSDMDDSLEIASIDCKIPLAEIYARINFQRDRLTTESPTGKVPPLEIDVQSVKSMLDRGTDFLLVDCREPDEYQHCRIQGSVLIPMNDTPLRLGEIERHSGKPIIVHCHHGKRSLQVVSFLRKNGLANAQSMAGGIDAWSCEIDPTVPRY